MAESKMPSFLWDAYQNDRFTDLDINFGGTLFRVHRLVVCHQSPTFDAICSDFDRQNAVGTDKAVLIINIENEPHLGEEHVRCLIHFLYNSEYCSFDNSPECDNDSGAVTPSTTVNQEFQNSRSITPETIQNDMYNLSVAVNGNVALTKSYEEDFWTMWEDSGEMLDKLSVYPYTIDPLSKQECDIVSRFRDSNEYQARWFKERRSLKDAKNQQERDGLKFGIHRWDIWGGDIDDVKWPKPETKDDPIKSTEHREDPQRPLSPTADSQVTTQDNKLAADADGVELTARFHAVMYALAIKYGIKNLGVYAKNAYEQTLKVQDIELNGFLDSIDVVYNTTSTSDRVLRDVVAEHLGTHIKEIKSIDVLRKLVLAAPDLAVDVLDLFRKAESIYDTLLGI